jgi:hypothetical protein
MDGMWLLSMTVVAALVNDYLVTINMHVNDFAFFIKSAQIQAKPGGVSQVRGSQIVENPYVIPLYVQAWCVRQARREPWVLFAAIR